MSRVFVSSDGTQAIVFTNDQGYRGDLFWLRRESPSDRWRIERVDLSWIN